LDKELLMSEPKPIAVTIAMAQKLTSLSRPIIINWICPLC